MPLRPTLSAVVACYDNARSLREMTDRLRRTFAKIGCSYEIIFVNDGSPDDTREVLRAICQEDTRVKAIQHSRNFGSQNAFYSGLLRATGEACVLLDGDLQDPPEIIEALVDKWRAGHDIVYGQRVKREMSGFQEFFRKRFYRAWRKFSYVSIPLDAGDFSLLDRKVVLSLLALPERARFIRGMRAWIGYRQAAVPYFRPERSHGRSSNNLASNIRWARKAFVNFSFAPLEFLYLLSGSLFVLSMGLGVVAFLVSSPLSWVISVSGFLTLLAGVLMLGMAILGDYLATILEEVKERPFALVQETLNFEDSSQPEPSSHSAVFKSPASSESSAFQPSEDKVF